MNRVRLFLSQNAYAIVLACSLFTLGVASQPVSGQQNQGDNKAGNDKPANQQK